jgi:NADPH-dependent ferric siderophore reductase
VHGEVVEVIRLSPSLIRVVLSGSGLEAFQPTEFADQYVNALFVPDGAPYTVPFDVDAARGLSVEHRPVGRRYTIRWWEPIERRLAIDFVTHGDTGIAGRWAQRARVGDRLQFTGPSGAYQPSADADWHLLVGDESALPAIAASMERLRAGVAALVFVVVDGPDDEITLATPADAHVHWVHRRTGGSLPDVVAGSPFPDGVPDVFVHGEASEVRAIRRHLLADRGIAREGTSISPYWRRGYDDEAWRQVKSAWLAESAADV